MPTVARPIAILAQRRGPPLEASIFGESSLPMDRKDTSERPRSSTERSPPPPSAVSRSAVGAMPAVKGHAAERRSSHSMRV